MNRVKSKNLGFGLTLRVWFGKIWYVTRCRRT